MAWTLSISWMVIGATLTFVLLPVVPIKRSTYWWIIPGMPMCLRFCLARLRVIHHPDFDKTRSSLFLQNHVSVLDGHAACAVIPQRFCGMMNAAHFKIPGYGWIMKLTKGIPVFPRASGRTAEVTAICTERVNSGISILAFPEGHRTVDGKVRKFRRGVFFIARDAGIPVVPIAVRGIHDLNHKPQQLIINPFKTITIFVGPQFETKGLSDDEVGQLSERVRRLIADWAERGELPDRVANTPTGISMWPLPSNYHSGAGGARNAHPK